MQMESLKCLGAMDFLKDWVAWRKTLGEALQKGRSLGMSDEQITELATKMGDFLAEKVCPASKEEELLKQLWDVGTPAERRTIAGLLIKIVS
jgi:hypothetical protein